MKSSIQSKRLQLPNDIEDLVSVLAVGGSGAGGGAGGGSGGGGIGGGGGSPGGGTPGGGGSGGKPGGESVGNNLSFPAIFFDPATQAALRGDNGTFTFTTPTDLNTDYLYFAQGVAGNEWQADSSVAAAPVTIDFVDIGDALESAPIKQGTNVRLELTLYQDLINLDSGELGDGLSQTAYAMTLLGGAKGSGKPSVVGPTESQGAQLLEGLWDGSPYAGTIGAAPAGTTYESDVASVCAASGAGETGVNSYMSMSIQKVEGLVGDEITGLAWDGTKWVDANPDDGITVGSNLVNTAFGPELNIAGKYIMGASGKPYKFTADGNYLVTFALEDGAPVRLDDSTVVTNDGDPAAIGYQPGDAAGRTTQVIADGDTHNGLLVMIVGVPSNPTEVELM